MTSDFDHFHAVTSLIHDLALTAAHYNPTSTFETEDYSSGSKQRAELLVALANLFVRDQEFVATAGSLSVKSDMVVQFEVAVCSHSFGQDPGPATFQNLLALFGGRIKLRDVLDLHARALDLQVYGGLIHHLLQDYLDNMHHAEKAINIRLMISACVLLNSAPSLVRKLNWESPNITLLMDTLGRSDLRLDNIHHPAPAFAADITLLQMLTKEIWSTSDGPFVPDDLQDLADYCAEGNIAPDFELWTPSHWQQFIQCISFLLRRLNCSVHRMAHFSAFIRDQKPQITDHLVDDLWVAWVRLEADYRILEQLQNSASFFNLLLMLESSLQSAFSDSSYRSEGPQCSMQSTILAAQDTWNQWPPAQYVNFYCSWLKSQNLHLQACDTLNRFGSSIAPKMFCEHNLNKIPHIELVFTYVSIYDGTHGTTGYDDEISRRLRHEVVDSLLPDDASYDFSETFVREALFSLAPCPQPHSPLIHPAIHIGTMISQCAQGMFTSDFYPDIGASAYCCAHYRAMLKHHIFASESSSNSGFQDTQPSAFAIIGFNFTTDNPCVDEASCIPLRPSPSKFGSQAPIFEQETRKQCTTPTRQSSVIINRRVRRDIPKVSVEDDSQS